VTGYLSHYNQRRLAFTLIELLVVIAVIGTLTSMLLPAIQKVRETANGAVCLSNIRQLGVAVQSYAAQNGDQLPPLCAAYDPAQPGTYNGTILFTLLPYIEQGELYSQRMQNPQNTAGYNSQGNYVPAQIKLYVCPMDYTVTNGVNQFGAAAASYAANYQLFGSLELNGGFYSQFSISNIPTGTTNNVIFAEHLSTSYVAGGPTNNAWDLWTTTSQCYYSDTNGDGNHGPWFGVNGGLPYLPGWCANGNTLSTGGPYYWYSIQIKPTPATACDKCSISSGHSNGIRIGLLDGSAQTMSGSTDLAAWQNAINPNVGNTGGAW
jgi:prepilin-type N-terminal cleavage/methylation domain-containing protein